MYFTLLWGCAKFHTMFVTFLYLLLSVIYLWAIPVVYCALFNFNYNCIVLHGLDCILQPSFNHDEFNIMDDGSVKLCVCVCVCVCVYVSNLINKTQLAKCHLMCNSWQFWPPTYDVCTDRCQRTFCRAWSADIKVLCTKTWNNIHIYNLSRKTTNIQK
jgi:hypothetical protein